MNLKCVRKQAFVRESLLFYLTGSGEERGVCSCGQGRESPGNSKRRRADDRESLKVDTTSTAT